MTRWLLVMILMHLIFSHLAPKPLLDQQPRCKSGTTYCLP